MWTCCCFRHVSSSPTWGKSLTASLQFGTTSVQFTVQSPSSSYIAKCNISIYVKGTVKKRKSKTCLKHSIFGLENILTFKQIQRYFGDFKQKCCNVKYFICRKKQNVIYNTSASKAFYITLIVVLSSIQRK